MNRQSCKLSYLLIGTRVCYPPVAQGRAGCLISICPDKTQDEVQFLTGGPIIKIVKVSYK